MSQEALEEQRPKTPLLNIQLRAKWLRGRERIDWRAGFTSWWIGKRKSGKSNGAEVVATRCMDNGSNTIFDICGSGDGENFAWCRSPYKDNILIVHGSGMKVTSPFNHMHISEFKLKECEKYSVVITNPMLYRGKRDYFTGIAYMMDNHFMKRGVWTNSIVLLIREARKILMSRMISGKSSNMALAQAEFVDMHSEAEHTGIANVIDALRPNSIVPDVREVANYTFIKTFGAMKFPQDMHNIMREVIPEWMRRMPKDRFVLYTDSDNIGVGNLGLVPWHHQRGEPILKTLGIQIEEVNEEPDGEDAQELKQAMIPTQSEVHKKEEMIEHNTEMHKAMLELKRQKKTYIQILNQLIAEGKMDSKVTWHTVRYHLGNKCACKIDNQTT